MDGLGLSTTPLREGPAIRGWFSPAPPAPHEHATSNHGDAHPGRDEGRSTKPFHFIRLRAGRPKA
jgi:hypothetical protein